MKTKIVAALLGDPPKADVALVCDAANAMPLRSPLVDGSATASGA